jgi:hypothetical protein
VLQLLQLLQVGASPDRGSGSSRQHKRQERRRRVEPGEEKESKQAGKQFLCSHWTPRARRQPTKKAPGNFDDKVAHKPLKSDNYTTVFRTYGSYGPGTLGNTASLVVKL